MAVLVAQSHDDLIALLNGAKAESELSASSSGASDAPIEIEIGDDGHVTDRSRALGVLRDAPPRHLAPSATEDDCAACGSRRALYFASPPPPSLVGICIYKKYTYI